jgi:beta-glucanase (GH16 family)
MRPTYPASSGKSRCNLIFRLHLLAAALCLILPAAAGAQTWTVKFQDNFAGAAGASPNAANWNYDLGNNGGWGNGELEIYCGPKNFTGNDPKCDPNNPNVYLDGNGHLVIQAIRKDGNVVTGSYTSARLLSANLQTFSYGRIEATMQLPQGAGVWPAFWGLGSNILGGDNPGGTVPWPSSGEMDIMEHVQNLGPSNVQSTLHGGISSSDCYCGANGLAKKSPTLGSNVSNSHVYGAIWSPDMVQFYVDDPTKIFSIETPESAPAGQPWDFNHPFFLLINLAIGGPTSGFSGPADGTNTCSVLPVPPPGAPPSPSTTGSCTMLVGPVTVYTAGGIAPPVFGTPNPSSLSFVAGAAAGNSTVMTPNLAANTGYTYFSCTTTAAEASCAISTNDPLNAHVINSNAVQPETLTVTVTTTANSILPPFFFTPHIRFWAPVLIAAISILVVAFLIPRSRRSARRWSYSLALAGVVLAGGFVAGCGGGGASGGGNGGGGGTPPNSYTVTVNAFTEGNTTPAVPDATTNISFTVLP